MEYLTVKEISKLWNMKERKITSLCREERIPGIRKINNTWLIPSDSLIPLDKRKKEYIKKTSNTKESMILYTSKGAREKVIEDYKRIYGKNPSFLTYIPYTMCPIGAHTDHNLGLTLSFAIDKGIHIAYSKKENGIIEIINYQIRKRVEWHVLYPSIEKENDWADILRGATASLLKRYPLKIGLSAIIDGELPIGASSSSKAIVLSFINSLAFLNNIKITNKELIEIAKESCKDYIGLNNGKLNQFSEILCKKNNLLYMDMKNEENILVKKPKDLNFSIGIFFSGVECLETHDDYNRRVEELRASSYLIKAYTGQDHNKVSDSNMRDIDINTYLKYKNKLPSIFIKRANHFYNECERVKKGVDYFKEGNIEEFGKLMTQSGTSSIENWDIGTAPLIQLFEILKNKSEVYGTRFSNTGFNGFCIALIKPGKEKEIFDYVEKEYLKKYPHLKNKYSAHLCHMADGLILDK